MYACSSKKDGYASILAGGMVLDRLKTGEMLVSARSSALSTSSASAVYVYVFYDG